MVATMLETAFTGTLGRDPELKTSASGKVYCNVPVAVGNGDQTVWIRVACFGEIAQDFAARAHKGDHVAVEGKLTLNTYTARDGTRQAGFNVAASYVRICEIGQRRARKTTRRKPDRPVPNGDNRPFNDEIGF
jgi:single stranded DNA-binding protein